MESCPGQLFFFIIFFYACVCWFEMERGREFVGKVKKEVKGGKRGERGGFIYIYIYLAGFAL